MLQVTKNVHQMHYQHAKCPKTLIQLGDIKKGGLYTAPHDLPDSVRFRRSLLESTRLVTQTFSVSHRPNWQVQSGVVRQNMPCSGGLPGFGPDFSVNQVHWTPLDSTGFQQLHWTPADSAGFHGLQWILLDSGGLCMTSLFNY